MYTITAVDIVLIAIASFLAGVLAGWYVYRRRPQPNIDVVEDAVYDAFVRSGLPANAFSMDYDILAIHGPRKVGEVYYHASRSLGQDHAWGTVQDVVDAFQEP